MNKHDRKTEDREAVETLSEMLDAGEEWSADSYVNPHDDDTTYNNLPDTIPAQYEAEHRTYEDGSDVSDLLWNDDGTKAVEAKVTIKHQHKTGNRGYGASGVC